MATHAAYPIRVEARLDPDLSRWLWLVKWFLVIPHFFVLAFLWVAFAVTSVIAFFAILFSGRYPRALFEFNVGVLRWSWRVSYYSYGALGTDKYPPFTLAEVPEYPAHLSIAYPEHLSRGLVLVKWWLLAIPHYIIVGFFLGGTYVAAREAYLATSGLIELLVVIAAIILLFTGSYPRSLFDLVLGMNRWVLRVAAYAGLMTDQYPPFRLDMGGSENGETLALDAPPATPAAGASTKRWGPGSITALIAGSIAALMAVGLLAGGGLLLWVDRTQRDGAGFVRSPSQDFATSGAALVTKGIRIDAEGPDELYPERILGDAKVSVTDRNDGRLFVGVARTEAVERYLDGVPFGRVVSIEDDRIRDHDGAGTPAPPAEQDFWITSATGAGTQTVTWAPDDERWSLVVMNADASSGIDVDARAGAELPALGWIAGAVLIAGLVVAAVALALILGAARAAHRNVPRQP